MLHNWNEGCTWKKGQGHFHGFRASISFVEQLDASFLFENYYLVTPKVFYVENAMSPHVGM